MKKGDVRKFNPEGREVLTYAGIKNGEDVILTRVGKAYNYEGLRPGVLVREVDFRVVSSGVEYEMFSSQYVGYIEPEVTEGEMDDF